MPSSTGGSLVDKLPYWGFLYPDVIITRSGELLLCAKVATRSVDGAAPEDLDRVTQSWQRFFGSIEHSHRAYVIFERRPAEPKPPHLSGMSEMGDLVQKKRYSFVQHTLSTMDVWVVYAYQPGFKHQVSDEQSTWFIEYVRNWLGRFKQNPPITKYLASVVEAGVQNARTSWRVLAPLLDEVTPVRPVRGREFASLLYRMVNMRGKGWLLGQRLPNYGLSVNLADSVLAFYRTHAEVDERLVGLFSLALPARRIMANALAPLYSQPWEFNSVLEWRPLERETVQQKIRAVQKHFNNLRWSVFSAMQETEGTGMAVEDAGAASSVHMLDRANIELTTEGIPYGEVALSFAVVGNDREELDNRGAEINRAFVDLDAKVMRERFGQPAIWFQRFAGSPRKALVRPMMVSSGQAACLAPVFGASPGYPDCDHLNGKSVLATFKTRWSTAYGHDLFAGGDVGHTIVLGATGSGKSFLLNFLLCQSLQYQPRIVVLDLGGSYKAITEIMKGSYLSMQVDASGKVAEGVGAGLRPFQLPAGERTYTFLANWVSRILQIGGYEPTGDDVNMIRDRVVDVYKYDRRDRTLGDLAKTLPAPMWPALSRWVEDGQWAQTFDGPPPTEEEMDNLNTEWQVVDLAGAVNFPDWTAAALFFMFERLRLQIDDDASVGRLKIMVVDEAWHFLNDPSIVTYLAEAAKTWRKRNGVLIMATQSVGDVSVNPRAKALLESMPTRLFLANAAFPPAAAELFDLTESEFEVVRELVPKREIFLHRAGLGHKVVLNLDVDDESYWLYTSSPEEAARRAKAIERFGLIGGIQRLATGMDAESSVDQASLLFS